MLPYRAFFVRARPSSGLHPRGRSGAGKIEGWYRTGVAARKYTGHTGKYAGKNHVIPAVMGTFLVSVFTQLTGNSSMGVLSIAVLFVLGFVLLWRMPEKQG